MKNRTDIKEFILGIEKNFHVNDWTVNGIHVWPFIRIRLFFYLIRNLESQPQNDNKSDSAVVFSKQSLFQNAIVKTKQFLAALNYLKWHWLLPSKKYLFLGADGHRVNFRGQRFNRYFDVFIDNNNLQSESLYFEYDKLPIENQYNKSLLYKHHQPYVGFLHYQKRLGKKPNLDFQWEGFKPFHDFLIQNPITQQFAESYTQSDLEKWAESFVNKVAFFKKTLRKINPKKVLILCYYSDDVMALTVAANQSNIATIEMQHGPQTELHLAYSNWTRLPATGYDALPRNYWCWDSYSQSVLEQWISKNDRYQTKVVGNPWVDFWKNNATPYPHSDYILYSLQPKPVTLAELFPPLLIDFIQQNHYKWFLRLHPRQLNEKPAIEKFLKEQNVLHLVTIEAATNDPLPQLLANARIHLTHFSGSTIEAALFNVYTVLLNELGVASFPDLIAKKQAVFLDPMDVAFANNFKGILENNVMHIKKGVLEDITPEGSGNDLF